MVCLFCWKSAFIYPFKKTTKNSSSQEWQCNFKKKKKADSSQYVQNHSVDISQPNNALCWIQVTDVESPLQYMINSRYGVRERGSSVPHVSDMLGSPRAVLSSLLCPRQQQPPPPEGETHRSARTVRLPTSGEEEEEEKDQDPAWGSGSLRRCEHSPPVVAPRLPLAPFFFCATSVHSLNYSLLHIFFVNFLFFFFCMCWLSLWQFTPHLGDNVLTPRSSKTGGGCW